MKITIEATPSIVDIDGVKCRLWNGTLPTGAPCQVMVHRIGVADADCEPNGFRELAEQAPPDKSVDVVTIEGIRDQVLHYWRLYQAACAEPDCREKGNILAFLAHSLGVTKDDVRNFETLLVRYDIECPGNSGCLHPAKREVRHGG